MLNWLWVIFPDVLKVSDDLLLCFAYLCRQQKFSSSHLNSDKAVKAVSHEEALVIDHTAMELYKHSLNLDEFVRV